MTSDTRPHAVHVQGRFFRTGARPCPYLPDRIERSVFTELAPDSGRGLYDALVHGGFRRSHAMAYRPDCPTCSACVPVRVIVEKFRRGRSFRRVWSKNADLTAFDLAAGATADQYHLFVRYQRSRHYGGEMSLMDFQDYATMVEDSPLDTRLIEFRAADGDLVAACLADRLGDGLSAVYSFFEPGLAERSLGNHMVLWLIERAQTLGLPYVYLGYWIGGSPKMAYKARFRPLQGLGPAGWRYLP